MIDTIHAERVYAETCNFCMAAFLTGYGIKGRTHTHAKIAYFSTRCIIRTWKTLSLQIRASQVLMMHLVGKCADSARAWILAIFPYISRMAAYIQKSNWQCNLGTGIELSIDPNIFFNRRINTLSFLCPAIWNILGAWQFKNSLVTIKTLLVIVCR